MIEYELIKHRREQLLAEAEHWRLVHSAEAAERSTRRAAPRAGGSRAARAVRRITGAVRHAAAAESRPTRLGEC